MKTSTRFNHLFVSGQAVRVQIPGLGMLYMRRYAGQYVALLNRFGGRCLIRRGQTPFNAYQAVADMVRKSMGLGVMHLTELAGQVIVDYRGDRHHGMQEFRVIPEAEFMKIAESGFHQNPKAWKEIGVGLFLGE